MVTERSGSPAFPAPLSQDAAQAAPYPPVDGFKGRPMAVFKILIPAFQRPVDVRDDRLQALPVRALRLRLDRLFQLLHILRAWPSQAPLEVIPEEVEPSILLPGVNDPRLLRVKCQSCFCRPSPHLFQRLLGFFFASAQDYEVVCVSYHLISELFHPLIQLVQVDIAQQRADSGTLRCPRLRYPSCHSFQHLLVQVSSQHLRHPSVAHFLLDSLHQRFFGDRVEVAFQVRIYYPVLACFQQSVHSPKRIFASSPRPESVTLLRKIPFKDRFQYVSQCGLRHSIAHRRYSQRPLFPAPGLRYPRPLYRSRPVPPVCHLRRQFLQVRHQVALEHLDRLMVYSCSSSSPLYFLIRGQQVRQPVHLIHQAVPFASFHPFFKGRQHPFRPYRWFHPSPSGLGLSGLFSLWHCRRSFFLRYLRHVSTFLRSLRSTSVTRFLRYYGRSDSCSLGSSAYTRSRVLSHELLTCCEQVSPITRVGLPDHSVSNHPTCTPSLLLHATPQLDGSPLSRSRFRLCASGLTGTPGRIEFVTLRTGRSPPVAPHLASRRRSYSRLRAGERVPEGDFHPSVQRASRAH